MGDKHQDQNKPKQKHSAGGGNHAKPHRPHSPKNHNNNNSHTNHNHTKGNVPTKDDLWKNAEVKTLKDNPGWIVEMTGLDSKTHTVYARAVTTADFKSPSVHPLPSIREVVDSVVDVAWKHVAKHILEAKAKQAKAKAAAADAKKSKKKNDNDASAALSDEEILRVDLDHWNQGAFPPANRLLELGAVWLVNETSFLEQQAATADAHKKKHHPHTKKKRLTHQSDGDQQPDWKDYVLRVHYAPNRYHAMEEVDWAKYCRGLLLGDHSVQVFLGGRLLAAHEHVPLSGYPDQKDGVIVYEDAQHGFVILNKPGTVPDHATVNNHAEDVLSVFSHVLHDREEQAKKEPKKDKKKDPNASNAPLDNHHHVRAAHLSLPLPLDTETQGLIIISTKRAFGSYLTNMVEHTPKDLHGAAAVAHNHHHGVVKKYKCLICVKRPEDMVILNNLQESGAVVTHYYHHNPNHKDHNNFVKEIPKNQHPHEYGISEIRLLKIGTNHGLYAANVTADSTVGDAHLARRLWGLGVQNNSLTPAEDLGISYVAQLELEQIVDNEQLHTHLNKASRLTPQQLICGQMAALGFPLVGDAIHGGGTSEVWGLRHGWNRLALQCCEWSFPQPYWQKPAEPTATNGSSNAKAEAPTNGNAVKSEAPTNGNAAKEEAPTNGDAAKAEDATSGDAAKAEDATSGDAAKAEEATSGDAADATSGDAAKAEEATSGDAAKAEEATSGDAAKAEDTNVKAEEGDNKTPAPTQSLDATTIDEKKEEPKPAAEGEEGWMTVSVAKKHPPIKAAGSNGSVGSHPTKQQHHNQAGKSQLLASPVDRCVFRLNEAWWNPLLDQYHVDGF